TMDQVLLLSQKHGAPPEERVLDVLHRNAAEETFELTFAGGHGKLIPKVQKAGVKLTPVEMWVANHARPFTRQDVVQAMKDPASGLGRTQVYEQLKAMVADGRLVETFAEGKAVLQPTAAVEALVGW